MKPWTLFAASRIAASTLFVTGMALADTRPEIDVSVRETLKEFDAMDSHHRHMLHAAAGALVFPRVTKAGAGIGGEYGEGVLRVEGKTVGYYSVSSASVGLTLGAARRSEIIVFTRKRRWTNSRPAKVGRRAPMQAWP